MQENLHLTTCCLGRSSGPAESRSNPSRCTNERAVLGRLFHWSDINISVTLTDVAVSQPLLYSDFMRQTKKSKKPIFIQKPGIQTLVTMCVLLTGVVLGMGVAYLAWQKNDRDPRYTLASRSTLKAERTAIIERYKLVSSTQCDDATDSIPESAREQVFDEYLKINKYGNRAVIRGCNDIDTLLAKHPISGEWYATSINVSLDTRANPAWQIECLVDDITEADDVVRPENTSIDATNLVECRNLKEREQIYGILTKSGEVDEESISDENIDAYINNASNAE